MGSAEAIEAVAGEFGLSAIDVCTILSGATKSPRNCEEALRIARYEIRGLSAEFSGNMRDGCLTDVEFTLKGRALDALATVGSSATMERGV